MLVSSPLSPNLTEQGASKRKDEALEAITGSSGEPHSIKTPYFPALDGLRALAFLCVFLGHYFLLPWGWAGVDLFFVLSGFLITGILFDTRYDLNRVRNFYVRRTLRIFPLYYGVVAVLIFTTPFFRWAWDWSWLAWPAYLGNFLRGLPLPIDHGAFQRLADAQPVSRAFPQLRLFFGHFWSLCVEEQFYLFWPWIVFAVKDRRKLITICAFFIVLCPVLRAGASQTLPTYMIEEQVLYRWTPFRIDALLFGGIIALVRRGPASNKLFPIARSLAWPLTILLAALIRTQEKGHWEATVGVVLVDMISACLIIMALKESSLVFRFFRLQPLKWVGRISYGAYVYHDIFHLQYDQLVIKYFGTKYVVLVAAPFALIATLTLSWISFHYYESWFIRLKDRLTRFDPRTDDSHYETSHAHVNPQTPHDQPKWA